MKRKASDTRIPAWLGWVVAAVFASGAAAERGKNHYILDCPPPCVPAQVATDTGIGSPGAVATDAKGDVYFSSENIVFRLHGDGTMVRIAGNGTPGFAGDGGPAVAALLNFPREYPELDADPMDFLPFAGPLAVDADGNVFIGDAYNNRIRRVDAAGMISTVAGAGGPGLPAQETDVRFSWVQGLAMGPDAALYVSSTWGNVSRIDAGGAVVPLAANNCGGNWPGQGLCAPTQIAVDAGGNVFVADAYCRVRTVAPTGVVTTFAGYEQRSERSPNGYTWECGYSGENTPANATRLSNYPQGVAVDAGGNVYIADTWNHCVRKVDAARRVTTVAGTCRRSGFAGDGGAAVAALLSTPQGVAVDRRGNLYIADTGNHRVRRVRADGIVTTVAGNGNALLR